MLRINPVTITFICCRLLYYNTRTQVYSLAAAMSDVSRVVTRVVAIAAEACMSLNTRVNWFMSLVFELVILSKNSIGHLTFSEI